MPIVFFRERAGTVRNAWRIRGGGRRRRLAPLAHADTLDRIELPCAVVHPASFPALAAALGLTTEQLAAVVRCERALIDGEIVDEQTAYERGHDVDFGAHTGADALVDRAPEWLIRHVPAEPSRAAAAGGAWLEPPIDAVDVAYIDLTAAASRLRRLVELNAPEILCRMAKHNLQAVFESLVELRACGADRVVWQPFQELMTGTPPGPGAEPPMLLLACKDASDLDVPRDARVLRDGFLVMFPFASVVIGPDGEIRDVFPTCDLRPVGDDGASILLLSGGGPTAMTGYFTPSAIVRDVVHRRWHTGAVPASLPRFVAGAIGDVKWAIVADLEQSRGYRLSPHTMSDQCGGTFNSADGRHAFDGGHFVVEAATGRPVFDARGLTGLELRSFAQRADGTWRFVVVAFDEDEEPLGVRVVDGHGATVRDIPEDTVAVLAPGGEQLLLCTRAELQLVDLDTGEQRRRLDLTPLAGALALPEDTELWRDLLVAYGIAEPIADEPLASLRAARARACWNDDTATDEDYAKIVEQARAHPKLSQIERL